MSIEAAARQARDVFGEVLDTLRREAPGTPLNNHRFDGLGIRAYAAIAALDAVLAATPKPLDDPRLQGLFSDAISGALAFGAQNTNPPPAGHWLERFWQMGRDERALSEAAPPAAEPPSTPEMAALWQKICSPLTGDEFQRHVTAILLRFAPPPAEPDVWLGHSWVVPHGQAGGVPFTQLMSDSVTVNPAAAPPAAEPAALTDEVLRYAMAAMGTGSPMDAEKFRLFWRYAHDAAMGQLK
jgi:hypothetical protein